MTCDNIFIRYFQNCVKKINGNKISSFTRFLVLLYLAQRERESEHTILLLLVLVLFINLQKFFRLFFQIVVRSRWCIRHGYRTAWRLQTYVRLSHPFSWIGSQGRAHLSQILCSKSRRMHLIFFLNIATTTTISSQSLL